MAGTYSDAELEGMLAAGEGESVEFKESLSGEARKRIREAVCGFANDLANHRRAGVVFVGVDNAGQPNGLDISDGLLTNLSNVRSDGNIVPPPTLSVEKRTLRGDEVAVVTVHPSDSPPVSYQGRIVVRIGPTGRVATAQDERILNERRWYLDRYFDAQPVRRARIADLDLLRFEGEYLIAAVNPELLARNDRTVEERLAATKMIISVADPIPTVTGILTLGKSPLDFFPGAYVQFLRIAGQKLGDEIVDEGQYDGPIAQVIRRLDEKLRAHIRTSIDIRSGPVEQRHSSYPLFALQQLTRNAVMHRTYEATNAPVRVYWYDDRVEIMSPGGPYGIVTKETFGQPEAVDYRNPNLTETMRALGLVQRFGYGIQDARRALHENDQPDPEFRVDPNWVSCTVRAGS